MVRLDCDECIGGRPTCDLPRRRRELAERLLELRARGPVSPVANDRALLLAPCLAVSTLAVVGLSLLERGPDRALARASIRLPCSPLSIALVTSVRYCSTADSDCSQTGLAIPSFSASVTASARSARTRLPRANGPLDIRLGVIPGILHPAPPPVPKMSFVYVPETPPSMLKSSRRLVGLSRCWDRLRPSELR